MANVTTRTAVKHSQHQSQDRPDLKFAALQVCCAMAKPLASDLEQAKRIGRYLVVKPQSACSTGSRVVNFEAYSDADWRGDKVTGGQCQLE